ncbi:hypothetical protein HZA33_03905 [Candidatus Pacearchaeota archaeon]|nr:hypothetical protein [Candidatus Pacearchaeota archaeon]
MKLKNLLHSKIAKSYLWIVLISISLLILSTFFVLSLSAGPIILTDKADYSPGETVLISGSGFNANSEITISVTRPDLTIDFGIADSDSSENFNYNYILNGIEGLYFVQASDGINYAETNFTDYAGTIWTTRDDCGEEIQDENHYMVGETVYINGAGFTGGTTDKQWRIKGLPGDASCDPGEIVASGTENLGEEFCFAAYTVGDDGDAECGEYKVSVKKPSWSWNNAKKDNYNVVECRVDSDCAQTQDPCYITRCVDYQCTDVLDDDEGPVTSDLTAEKISEQCKINIEATETDTCSNVAAAEYFLGGSTCGVEGTGTAMNAKDGTFNELIEDVLKNNVIVNDGSLNIHVRGNDSAGNWGPCETIRIDLDCLPPDYPTCEQGDNNPGIALNGECNTQELLVCGEDPLLTANICDDQSRIQLAEYFIDEDNPINWHGIYMSASDGEYDEQCEDVEAIINTDKLEEGTHYVQLHGKDGQENWGKFTFSPIVSFIKDTTSPSTRKSVDDPKIQCGFGDGENEVEECWYIQQGTEITLSAIDPDTPDHEIAGLDKIMCQFRWKLDWQDEWSEWTEPAECPNPIVFKEDSIHEIKYWAVDKCRNSEDPHYEIDIVDTQVPLSEKQIIGPQFYNETENKTYIDGRTLIKLTCEDREPHPVNEVTIYYRYRIDEGQWNEWTEYEGPFGFEEESMHELEWYCEDALGNAEEVQGETDYVDHTAPETTKTYGEPYYEDNAEWITTETEITLTADDGDEIHDSGVSRTYWRNTLVDNEYCENQELCYFEAEGEGEWNVYEGPFTKREESCHLIEYYSVDNVEKTEEVKKQCVFVDNTAPETRKSVGEPKYEGEGDVDWWITQDTEITLDCQDQYPHPVNDVTLYYRDYLEGEEAPEFTAVQGGYVEIQKEEDCKHVLEWYCVDALGNSEGSAEKPLRELDQVDTQAPEIVKWVVDNTVQQGDSVRICANVTDKKQTGDAGVGVAWVQAHLSLGDDPDGIDLINVGGDTYCGDWIAPEIKQCYRCWGWPQHCEYRCVWELDVDAADWLGNYNIEDGVEIIVDNADPRIQAVLWPSKDKYYREGKKFEVKALAIDFGGDENISNSDNCKASGVKECRFYAIKYDFESVDQSQIKNLWDYLEWLEETLDEPVQVVPLGSVPWEDGYCKGSLQFPVDSGLQNEDILFLAYEIEDNAGNINSGLGEDWDGDKITMKIDSEGPQVIIGENNLPGPFTKGDLLRVFASVEDIDSGYDSCWADIYKCVGEEGSCSETEDTGYNLAGYGSGYDTCEISDELPEGLASGNYELRVNAGDELQNIGYDWGYFSVDNTRPTMSVISPLKEEVYGLMFPVSLHVEDAHSSIAEETVKFRISEIPALGNIWCVFGSCEDSGWITLPKTIDSIYADTIDLNEHGISGEGRYIFNAVACDELYVEESDTDLGFSLGNSRTDMHCRMISEHGGVLEEPRAECNDGLDNDADGLIDYPADLGCDSSSDDEEYNEID